jgi:two-component system sensor histidine kinase BarA
MNETPDKLSITGNFGVTEPSDCEHQPAKQISILLVEDDRLVQKITQMQLQELGYIVETASTGEQAYQMIQLRSYHLILMDIGLPGWDGCTTTRKIKEWETLQNQTTPVIAVTAHADERIKQECFTVGMARVLIKPLKMATINCLIETLLKQGESKNHNPANVSSSCYAPDNEMVIDWSMAIELANGDVDVAQSVLQMLIESLPHERELIIEAYEQGDTEQLAKAVHKLHGGLCYCGTPRLKNAATSIEEGLRAKKNPLDIERLYRHLLQEIDSLLAFQPC